MNELEDASLGKPYVMASCPGNIPTAIGEIGSEHRPEVGHFLAALTTGEALGIYCALLGFWIEKFTPGIEVYHQLLAVDSLLMATETALGAFRFPALTHRMPPGSVFPTGLARRRGREAGWRVR